MFVRVSALFFFSFYFFNASLVPAHLGGEQSGEELFAEPQPLRRNVVGNSNRRPGQQKEKKREVWDRGY